MKAWVLHGISDLQLEEVKKPEPAEGEVLLAVKAAGICGSDIPRVYQTGMYSHPLIPGHEFSGVVEAVGTGTDNRWLYKRVGVYPLIPCRECVPCKKSQYEMCRNYSYLGSRRNGGFAEYVTVPEESLIELPDAVSYEAAAMLEPMAVAVHAIRKSRVDATQTVAVCGLGTIGLLLVMFLKQIGVKQILVIGSKSIQKDLAGKLGIEDNCYCDGKAEPLVPWIMNRTDGQGVDVFFECVGSSKTIQSAIGCAAPGGCVQMVGNPASDICFEKNIYWKILRNQLTVKGSWNSSFTHSMEDDWHYVLEQLKSGSVTPELLITHRLCLEALEDGLLTMRDKTEEYGKVMLV